MMIAFGGLVVQTLHYTYTMELAAGWFRAKPLFAVHGLPGAVAVSSGVGHKPWLAGSEASGF